MTESEGYQGLANPDKLSRAAEALRDPLTLLEVDVSYPGWEHEIAGHRAFYVRGFTWFLDRVLARFRNVTDLQPYIPEMKERIAQRPEWLQLPFNWDAPFSVRQVVEAASAKGPRRTASFHKALEIITLCEVVASDRAISTAEAPDPADVYTHMRIEPAVSFIHGLDRGVLNDLSGQQLATLRAWTGQRSNDVFYDMADGKTVTHKLAQRTLNFFNRYPTSSRLGDTDFHFDRRRSYKPSNFENVDVKEGDLPFEAREPLSNEWRESDREPGARSRKGTSYAEADAATARVLLGDSELSAIEKPSGLWLATTRGPLLSAHAPREGQSLTVFWPFGRAEAPFVRYFENLIAEAPRARRVVSFFYEDRLVVEETDEDGDGEDVAGDDPNCLLPISVTDDWRSGAQSVVLEFKPHGKRFNATPQSVWFSPFAVRGHREAGVSIGRYELAGSRESLALLIAKTHEAAPTTALSIARTSRILFDISTMANGTLRGGQ